PVVGALVDDVGRPRAGVAGVVPARLHEGVEGVGLALGRATALRTGAPAPFRVGLDRRGHAREGDILGEYHRQLVLRHGHLATGRAMDDRDRTAPVALPAHTPVAQAEI